MTTFRLYQLVAILLLVTPVMAADFHIDPVAGDPAGDGSAERPWRSLQEVINKGLVQTRSWNAYPYTKADRLVPVNADAPIGPGDTIWLRNGDYGNVMIMKHYNEGVITIAAQEGHSPCLMGLRIQASSNWAIKGLKFGPAFSKKGKPPRTMVDIESHGWNGPVHDILVEDCVLSSADDTSKWSADDWNRLSCTGIDADGDRIVIRGNRLKNVDSGISVGASHATVENNSVENFAGDGLRGLGDYSVFENNLVMNCYDVNGNHDDGFQSWSSSPSGVGTGEVVGLVLRGNTIINNVDPNQPHRGSLQGIGCFDGMFVDWTIENNVIIVDTYHGITLGGARNCKILNNTLIDPNNDRPGPATLRISRHKRGMSSSGCTVRNNLVSAISVQGEDMTVDHNLKIEDPTATFVDFAGRNLRLRKDSAAIDAGSAEMAPKVDIDGTPRPQGAAVDIGAYEYTGK